MESGIPGLTVVPFHSAWTPDFPAPATTPAPSPPAPPHACRSDPATARSAALCITAPAGACTYMVFGDARGSRTGTPALPFCDLKLRSPRPLDRAYPTELRAIGDHVRKCRLDLGLLQREVALRIGVDETTVFNWEAETASPGLRALPEVIRFLSYDPRLVRHLRQKQGLSMDALADLLDVGTSTVRGWECRGRRPSPRLHARLAEVLDLPPAAGTGPPWPGSGPDSGRSADW